MAPPPAPCVVAVVTILFGQSSVQVDPPLPSITSVAVDTLSFGNCSAVALLTVIELLIDAPAEPVTL